MAEVLEAAQLRLDKMQRKHGGLSPWLRGQGILNMQFAQEDYCWLDILVHSKLHQFLHLILGAGLSALPDKSALQKKAFHISVRTSRWTRLRRAEASDGAWPPAGQGAGVRAHSTGAA